MANNDIWLICVSIMDAEPNKFDGPDFFANFLGPEGPDNFQLSLNTGASILSISVAA